MSIEHSAQIMAKIRIGGAHEKTIKIGGIL